MRQLLGVTAFAALATVSFQEASQEKPSSFGWGVLALAFLIASVGTFVRDIETGVRWGLLSFLGTAAIVAATIGVVHLR
ncbi:MAG TPA: hypothetical protein VG125_25005 [Pirellulales bacterium]|nr:hypothetical protein [Pirellulales bacterium]